MAEANAGASDALKMAAYKQLADVLRDSLDPALWAEVQLSAAAQLVAERDAVKAELRRADVQVERLRQLTVTAKRVVNTIPAGEHVAVDIAAYNHLRDVLRGLGVLD